MSNYREKNANVIAFKEGIALVLEGVAQHYSIYISTTLYIYRPLDSIANQNAVFTFDYHRYVSFQAS